MCVFVLRGKMKVSWKRERSEKSENFQVYVCIYMCNHESDDYIYILWRYEIRERRETRQKVAAFILYL